MDNIEIPPQQSRQLSINRVVLAVLGLIIILVGAVYGIYSLSQPSARNKPAVSTNKLVSPHPANNNQTNSSAATTPNKNGSVASNSGTAQSNNQPGTGSSQLTNTGPGDTAAIGFIVATMFGAAIHYSWQRKQQL